MKKDKKKKPLKASVVEFEIKVQIAFFKFYFRLHRK